MGFWRSVAGPQMGSGMSVRNIVASSLRQSQTFRIDERVVHVSRRDCKFIPESHTMRLFTPSVAAAVIAVGTLALGGCQSNNPTTAPSGDQNAYAGGTGVFGEDPVN